MTAFYNELDPGAAAWLRELIRSGLIAPGVVDERSILDLEPVDLLGFTQIHFFAGIGGWSYALRLAGWPDDRPVWTGSPPCQPFSSAGRQKGRDDERHLAPHFIDLVRACRPRVLFGEQVASSEVFGKATKRARGKPIAPPQWAWLDDLSDRLEAARYAVGASDFPSAGVGAPHIRQRTFFGAVDLDGLADADRRECLGFPDGEGCQLNGPQDGREQGNGQLAASGELCGLADSSRERWDGRQDPARSRGGISSETSCIAGGPGPLHGFWRDADWLFCRDGKWRPVESTVLGLAARVPAELVRSGAFVPASYPLSKGGKDSRRVMRLRGYGNAINPHAAALFIQSFMEAADAVQ